VASAADRKKSNRKWTQRNGALASGQILEETWSLIGRRASVKVTGALNALFGSAWRGKFSLPTPAAAVILQGVSDVTRLLEAAAGGDRKAAADLLPLVYDELRELAAVRMAAEAPGHTLDATALVHEAYLRLVGDQQFGGRGHFFAAAAEAMRRILVENARRKARHKHGGGWRRQELPPDLPANEKSDDDVLAIDSALATLAQRDPLKARLVEMRFFGGLTGEQAALALGISPSAADRHWVFARAWLRRELGVGRKN
jgi:RNA polymerase sigma factor (TIGR02999 family)